VIGPERRSPRLAIFPAPPGGSNVFGPEPVSASESSPRPSSKPALKAYGFRPPPCEFTTPGLPRPSCDDGSRLTAEGDGLACRQGRCHRQSSTGLTRSGRYAVGQDSRRAATLIHREFMAGRETSIFVINRARRGLPAPAAQDSPSASARVTNRPQTCGMVPMLPRGRNQAVMDRIKAESWSRSAGMPLNGIFPISCSMSASWSRMRAKGRRVSKPASVDRNPALMKGLAGRTSVPAIRRICDRGDA